MTKTVEVGKVHPGVMVALLTSSMLILMGGAAVTPGLPGIEAHFAENADLASFIITLPHLAVAIVGFLMGVVSDKFGKARTLVASLLIFLFSGIGPYFMDNLYLILFCRFILGFGLAGIVCTVTSLIGSYYFGPKRVRMLGLQSASMGIGVFILELLGGALADMSWNSPFLVYLIAVPILALVLIFIREPEPSPVSNAENLTEVGGSTDMKTITACYLCIFIGMVIIFVVPTRMPSYMENVLGVSATMMGLFLGFHGMGNALFSCLHKSASRRLTSMQLVSVAFVILAFALALPYCVSETVPVCIVTLVVSGFSVGLIVPSIVNSIVDASNDRNRGKMLGIYAVFLNLGQFAVSLITIPVFDLAGNSYPLMFTMFAAVAVIMAVLVFLGFGIKKNKPQPPLQQGSS